jgi:ABC-type sulfate transport system substrate-binding protein
VIVDRNVDARTRPLVEAFVKYLWSEDAQQSFAKSGLRSVTAGTQRSPGKEFAEIELPFTVEVLGGWSRAYPEIVEGVWRDQVKKSQ